MKLVAAAAALLIYAGTAVATRGGRCAGNYNSDYCICEDTNVCASFGGRSDPGGPTEWPCPWDPDNVQACYVAPCTSGVSHCTWNCRGGTPLSGKADEVAPLCL